ncbi:MAG: UDP-N-acetylglucosamine 2-epimerase (non-hydrolyzing) [bacterium]
MLKVLCIVGTRPEAIKMAPVIRELGKYPDRIQTVVCSTGQHRQMLDDALTLFGIHPDIELSLMRANQDLAGLTARLLEALDRVLQEVRPDWVLAQGDTTTVLAAAMAAFYRHIRFGHVEAGLRTNDSQHPFPEEINRRMADGMADLLFAPTKSSRSNLLKERCAADKIIVTGNTVIDALKIVAAMDYDWGAGPLAGLPSDKRMVLVTAHRRESIDDEGGPFRELCLAIRDLAEHYAEKDTHFVYPVHLNPSVRRHVHEILSPARNITLLEPLDYLSLVQLMKRCSLVITDSGGIQEEAPGLGVPVLVMRETTERPEGLAEGVVKLVGTSRGRIRKEVRAVLDDAAAHQAMARAVNPYGDGKAAERIVAALLKTQRQTSRGPA